MRITLLLFLMSWKELPQSEYKSTKKIRDTTYHYHGLYLDLHPKCRVMRNQMGISPDDLDGPYLETDDGGMLYIKQRRDGSEQGNSSNIEGNALSGSTSSSSGKSTSSGMSGGMMTAIGAMVVALVLILRRRKKVSVKPDEQS